MDSDRRAMAHMKLPERGILRVTGIHDGHSHEKITGIITAPGIRTMQVSHKTDQRGRCTIGQELAVLVDRADTSKIAILWDEPAGSPPPFQYGPGQGGQPNTPQDIAAGVVSALDRAFRQRGRQVPPNVAARMEQALNRLGQAGAQGQAISDAINQALGHASGQQPYGPGAGQQYGQPYNPAGGQPYGPGPGQSYGPPSDQAGAPPFGQAGAPPFGQAGAPPFGQGGQGGQGGQAATGFPQVSWTDQQASGAGPQAAFDPTQPAQFPAGGAGELASAIVLAAQDVAPMPGIAAPGGAVDVTLEVRRADGSIYTARTRLSITSPQQKAAVATPGTQLTVRIDPNDPTRVEIDQYR